MTRWRATRSSRWWVAPCAALLLVLAGCAGEPEEPVSTAAVTPVPTLAPLADRRGCFAPLPEPPGAYAPVQCGDPSAEARQIDRASTPDPGSDGLFRPVCSGEYDFVLDVAADPALVSTLSADPEFSCMERLKAPFGDDQGQGRPPIVVGDCVLAGAPVTQGPLVQQFISELPCVEAARRPPAYEVFQVYPRARRIECPPERTDLSFSIAPLVPDSSGSDTQDACAELIEA